MEGWADALSRCPNYDQGDSDNENIMVLPDHLFLKATVSVDYQPPESQDLNVHCPWISAYNLKEDTGEWYKEGK